MARWIAVSVVIFAGMIWYPVELAFRQYCFNNYDLGIYAQALRVLGLSNLNPWLSTRDVRLFNDHFDPILFVFAPLTSLARPAPLAIRIEMISALIAAAAPVWLARRKVVSPLAGSLAGMLILFSPMTLDALYFPSHPGTWAIAPLSWMLASLFVGSSRAAFLLLIVLLSCKEEFPVTGALLGAAMVLGGERKTGIWFALVSAIWGVLVFYVRPMLLGPSDMYSNAVAGADGLGQLNSFEQWAPVLKRILYLFAPGVVVWWMMGVPRVARPIFLRGVLLATSGMLAIRFLGGYWGNHRSAALSVMSAYMVLGVWGDRGLSSPVSRRVVTLMVIFLLAHPLDAGSRWLRGLPFKRHCPGDRARVAAIDAAISAVRLAGGGPILAQGNLVPALADIDGVAHLGATQAREFKWVLAEKGPLRNSWPLSPEVFNEELTRWRSRSDAKVVVDDDWIVLLRVGDNP